MPPGLPSTTAERWLYAVKPASWPKLLVPCALGQAVGVLESGRLELPGLLTGATFTVLLLLYIVLLNDWGDRHVDAIKRRMFGDACSPKTIPDGILPAHQLLGVGLACGLGAVAVAAVASASMDRPLLVPAALGCLGLFWAYTLPPLKLNYRGGGELLEMIGVGVALPWINAYAQAGSVTPAGFLPLAAGFAAASLASALASGLSDERSDRRGGKRTATTVFGNRIVRRTAEASLLTGALVWGAYLLFCPIEVRAPLGVALFVMIGQWRQLRAQSRHATTDAFAAQKRYKAHLHRAIWRSATLLSLGMVAMTWWWEP